MKKILFYNDVAGFGGHELMALRIMGELVKIGCEVHSVCSDRNREYMAEAGTIEGITSHLLPFTLNRFNFATNKFNVPKIDYLRRLIRKVEPECVVAVQGNIEISSLVLPAAKRENVPLVTYIALAQTMKELGAPQAAVRDLFDKGLFAMPDRFVTIGASQREYLLSRGVAAHRIGVVPNVARFTPVSFDRTEARAALALEQELFTVGLVGRVVAAHKGHDQLLAAIASHRELLAGIRFVIVGNGPDLPRIRGQAASLGLEDRVRFLDWTDDMARVYAALDAVIIPSNHEGVPLVMIEAILNGLPVIASAIDGMLDHLPSEWLFPRGDLSLLAERIDFVATEDQKETIARVREAFERLFLRTTIGREFLQELEIAFSSRSR